MQAQALIILTQTGPEAPFQVAFVGTDREDYARAKENLREDGTYSGVYCYDNPQPKHFITPKLNGSKPKAAAEEKKKGKPASE